MTTDTRGPMLAATARGAADDEVMQVTRWAPLKGAGIGLCTHRLRAPSPKRIHFGITPSAAASCLVIAGIGASVLMNLPSGDKATVVALLGATLLIAGACVGRSMARPRVFDRGRGWFWKGAKPTSRPSASDGKVAGTLDEIHALQLIDGGGRGAAAAAASGDASGRHVVGLFRTYELNLVLRDGARINVVKCGSLDSLRADAGRLAKFLNVRLWDCA